MLHQQNALHLELQIISSSRIIFVIFSTITGFYRRSKPTSLILRTDITITSVRMILLSFSKSPVSTAIHAI